MAKSDDQRREQISLRADPAFRAAIERAAQSEHRTVSSFIRHVVARAIEQHEKARLAA